MRAKVQATLRRREGHLLPVAVRHANAHGSAARGALPARGASGTGEYSVLKYSVTPLVTSRAARKGAKILAPWGGQLLPVSACCATRTENMCSCPYCRLR